MASSSMAENTMCTALTLQTSMWTCSEIDKGPQILICMVYIKAWGPLAWACIRHVADHVYMRNTGCKLCSNVSCQCIMVCGQNVHAPEQSKCKYSSNQSSQPSWFVLQTKWILFCNIKIIQGPKNCRSVLKAETRGNFWEHHAWMSQNDAPCFILKKNIFSPRKGASFWDIPMLKIDPDPFCAQELSAETSTKSNSRNHPHQKRWGWW